MKALDVANSFVSEFDLRMYGLSIFRICHYIIYIGFIFFLWPAFGFAEAVDCNKCGPTYCAGTAAAGKAIDIKMKAAEKNEYPKRLIELYQNLDQCEACIAGSPDGFSLFRVDSKGNTTISAWDADNERIAAQQLKVGNLKFCYVILQRRACECCGSLQYSKTPDYDNNLDINRSLAIPCQK